MAKQILLVEDDPTCETLLKRAIHAIDPSAQVSTQESAEAATCAIQQGIQAGYKYDLIILDIFLAGKRTGIELWESIQYRFPATPILITSSLPLENFFKSIGRSSVAPPFLPKPFQLGECQQILTGLLKYG